MRQYGDELLHKKRLWKTGPGAPWQLSEKNRTPLEYYCFIKPVQAKPLKK